MFSFPVFGTLNRNARLPFSDGMNPLNHLAGMGFGTLCHFYPFCLRGDIQQFVDMHILIFLASDDSKVERANKNKTFMTIISSE